MDQAPAPSPVFKRRPKAGLVKTSSSSLSLRTLASDGDEVEPQQHSTPLRQQQTGDDKDNDSDGQQAATATSAVKSRIATANRKLGRGRAVGAASSSLTDRPPSKLKSRLSFGLQQDQASALLFMLTLVPVELNEYARLQDASDSTDDHLQSRAPGSHARRLFRPQQQSNQATLELSSATASPTASQNAPRAEYGGAIYSKAHLDELRANQLPSRQAASSYDDLTRSKFSKQLDNGDDGDMAGPIPSSAAIAEARKKRELLRTSGAQSSSAATTTQDDYISLQVGFAHKGGDSRLVREDDEIGDGDDDMAEFTGAQDKVPLGKKANKEAAQRLKSGMIDMIDEAEDDDADEETREWEQAQIKRGEQRYETLDNTSTKRTYIPAPIPRSAPLPSIDAVTARLSDALSTLESAHSMDSAALVHFEREKVELDEQEQELRREVERVEQKSRWFGDFKLFIEDIAAFLDEKYPQLESVEKENLAIQKERYDIVSRRRLQDDSDDIALFTGAHVATLMKAVSEDASRTVDELGRSAPSDQLAPKSATRIARRQARQKRLGSRKGVSSQEDYGMVTDDELDSGDAEDLQDALTSLRQSLARLFDDVKADDFRDPNLGIRTKFQEWRSQFTEEYQNAYGGLAMVGVWEFWARVEMAMWNPFEIQQLAKSPPGLDAYEWHANLTSFGHAAEDENDGRLVDESEEIVNLLVTSVIVPRLVSLTRASYDPFSRQQTLRALSLVDEVSYCVERSSPKFELLVSTFLERIQLCVSQSQALLLPHVQQVQVPSNALDPSTFQARTRFLKRQVKLLDNASKWRRYGKSVRLRAFAGQGQSGDDDEDAVELAGAGSLFDELLQRELVAKVMLPVIEASWASGGQEVAQEVVSLLPGDAPEALKRRLLGQQ
ncbi:hypothetical protein OIV83_003124 [Microbotryomycetes sp. JL201]|nr:hypothetical protein OIV83_003124 [Microbotryomycetes sp. JL201]